MIENAQKISHKTIPAFKISAACSRSDSIRLFISKFILFYGNSLVQSVLKFEDFLL